MTRKKIIYVYIYICVDIYIFVVIAIRCSRKQSGLTDMCTNDEKNKISQKIFGPVELFNLR